MITRPASHPRVSIAPLIAAISTALAISAAGCSLLRPPASTSINIIGDQLGHPTGQRFYPAGAGLPAIPPAVNTNGLYLLTKPDLIHLLLP